MDHPKPRNHPKGKSGPKKRVATDASLTPLETADVKKIKVTEDPMTDPAIDPTADLMTDQLPVPDIPDFCPTKTEDEEPSPLGSLSVKYELEHGLEPEFETDTDTEPSAEPSSEPSVEPEAELEFEPELEPGFESESESDFKPEGEEIEDQNVCLIKPEPEMLEEL